VVARVDRCRGFSLVRVAIIVGTVAAAFVAWRFLFPDDEHRIRARIEELETAVNTRSGEGAGRLADAARLLSFFTDDVLIEPGAPYPPIRGPQAVVAVLGRAREPGGFELAFEDVSVDVGPAGTATARLTATLSWINARTGEGTLDAREVAVDLRETAGEWKIAGARAVETLERPVR
jgi:ketosteroid isomerase-like protein